METQNFFFIDRDIDEGLFNDFSAFLIKAENNYSVVHLLFNSTGGKMLFAAKIIKLMIKSGIEFQGIAIGKVSSATIPIFLATSNRRGVVQSSALIHRASKENEDFSIEEIAIMERQFLEYIAQKLELLIDEVYEMADAKTVITIDHPLGKKFFTGN
ncbi:MAG: ATP-dependent Clp protease proteolytic subunit [Candidatus Paceibacterota bacterium]|jgi:ATP-dependent protease ClpP protease subunit